MEMRQPQISVIVPIYNVEKYVRKCLESLREQTMREIEVICIDDGSTDGSGRITDEFESQDWPLFRVIHTENRGLSAARNRGIDEAKANWIMFVDSDDWVSEEYCRVPYETAIAYGADLVCFRPYKVSGLGSVKKPKKTNTPIGVVDEMTAHEYGGTTVWNKLYRRTLFSEIRFPEGHVHEDLATAHRIVNKAKKVTLLSDRLYYHADRKGSICHTYTISYLRDRLVAGLDRYDFLVARGYPSWKIGWIPQSCAISLLSRSLPSQDTLYIRATEIVNNINGIPKEFGIKQKIALMAWKIDKRLFYMICRMNRSVKD